VRLIFELYALALRNPAAYRGVLEDPLAYWQKSRKRPASARRLTSVEPTLLLASIALLLDLCATGIVLVWDVRWRH